MNSKIHVSTERIVSQYKFLSKKRPSSLFPFIREKQEHGNSTRKIKNFPFVASLVYFQCSRLCFRMTVLNMTRFQTKTEMNVVVTYPRNSIHTNFNPLCLSVYLDWMSIQSLHIFILNFCFLVHL